jgi:hypothetical protein
MLFQGVEGAIKILSEGDERQQAMARRLRAIMDAECVQCHELLLTLVEIRREKLLPEDATLSLIIDGVRSSSDTAATQVVGYPEDFEILCENRVDELVSRLTQTILNYLRANPLPASKVEEAIVLASEQFDRSVVGTTYREQFSKQYAQDLRRYLMELGCSDILQMLDAPELLTEREGKGQRLLTGKDGSDKRRI